MSTTSNATDEELMNHIIKECNKKVKLIRKHQKELAELHKQCPHIGTVEQKSSYFSGSYLDTAYTRYWNQCTLCGQRSEDVIKDHSYYG